MHLYTEIVTIKLFMQVLIFILPTRPLAPPPPPTLSTSDMVLQKA